MAYICKECGCSCKKCISSDHDVQLHVEIENLKQRLVEKESHIVTMETHFLNESNKFPSGELVAIKEELLIWQDKYRRLYEAHRRVQRVNQGLEDKLLKLVDVCETDKNTLTKDVASLSHKLAEANYAIKKLTEDNERYKNDVNLAIQFLQCKQTNFVAHKYDSLPPEVQAQVSKFMSVKRKPDERKTISEVKSIKVPMPTFPPTAMVYSVPKSPESARKSEVGDVEQQPPVDIVSAAIMAKVLEERQKERALAKHCDSCTCAKNLQIVYNVTYHSIGTQTGDYKDNMACLRCNDILQVTQGGLKIVRDKIITTDHAPPYYLRENTESIQVTQTLERDAKTQPIKQFSVNKNDSKSNSTTSSLINLNSHTASSPKNNSTNPNNHVISSEHSIEHQETKLCNNVNDKLLSFIDKSTLDVESLEDMIDEKSCAKSITTSTNNLKGPRYCSMLVRSGTKNILLDNAQNNVTPVLYTRTMHKSTNDDTATATTHESSSYTPTSRSSSDYRINSMASETSTQNQQRVAEWIQNNLEENDVINTSSSPEHSHKCETFKEKKTLSLDKVKYAEMEENVKRFLFGENEFKKTVEIGKQKYQTYKKSNENPIGNGTGSLETNI